MLIVGADGLGYSVGRFRTRFGDYEGVLERLDHFVSEEPMNWLQVCGIMRPVPTDRHAMFRLLHFSLPLP